MQTVKTTEKKEPRSMIALEEGVKKLPGRVLGFLSQHKRRTIAIFAAMLLLGGALLLNWKLFGTEDSTLADGSEKEEADGTPVNKDEAEEDGSYFAMAIIDRQRARDEAMEVLQLVLDSVDATDTEKEQALQSIAVIAAEIEKEANIESLVKAKGFSDCVAVIKNGSISVIVETEASLMADEIAQITEIVYTQTGISPTSLNIVEKAPI